MIEKTGDLFTTDQQAIGHGVNCFGVMGAGIAKSFREFYPKNYEVYKDQCKVKGLLPGDVLIVPENDYEWGHTNGQRLIVNLATQRMPGPDARMSWVRASIMGATTQLLSLGVNSLALPQIGCGIGGLDWNDVKAVLVSVENYYDKSGYNFEFEVWEYK